MKFVRQKHGVTIGLFLILLILVQGCGNVTPEPISTQDQTAESQSTQFPSEILDEPDPLETMNPEISAPSPEGATVQIIASDQPTPAPTLSDWRDAPISPEGISERVFEIYKSGQTLGRDPHSFSVIGDCQSIPYVFMGPFTRGELEPGSSESQLWNAINTFKPSFKRWAVTARGGFTAASILNALQADSELCKPGETPLTCEYRLNNPAFVIITLETWLDPDSISRYETYLREIINTVIEKGSVPILLTKADSSELRNGQHIINPVIVNLAYEYQLPLVNFWRAAQYLDNFGIDPEREGFHLSPEGYNLKNILALRALYQVWTTVEGLDVAEVLPESTPTPTLEVTPNDVPQVSRPACEENCIYFGIAQSHDGEVTTGGVYVYDPENQALEQILPEGFDLQDVSNDGRQLLVNRESALFSIDLHNDSSSLISETFNFLGKQGAFWDAEEEEIIFLDKSQPIKIDGGEAFNLIPATGLEGLFFQGGSCITKDFCQSAGIFLQDQLGTLTKMDKFIKPVFSPDSSKVIYLNPDAATEENYGHIWYLIMEETAIGAASRRVLYFPEETGFMVYPEVKAFSFSADSDKLLILYNVYSEYYRYSLRLQTYLWDLNTGILYDYGKLDGVSGSLGPQLVWSPEGNQILFFLTDLTEGGKYLINLYQTDLLTGEKLFLLEEALISSNDYIYLTNLYWR